MEKEGPVLDHPKKRRRRKKSRDPVSAKLLITNAVKDEIGVISEDLFHDFFQTQHGPEKDGAGQKTLHYVAISLWSPITSDQIDEVSWKLLAVRPPESSVDDPASTLRISTKSTIIESFVQPSYGRYITKRDAKGQANFEIRITDVQPLNLDLVIVSVDGDALDRHDDVQSRFGGGYARSFIAIH